MDKKRTQLIITAVLVIVLAIVLINSFKPRRGRRPSAAPAGNSVTKTILPAPLKKEIKSVSLASPADIEEQKKRASTDWGIDPFYHKAKEELYQGSNLVLKGVSIGRDKKNYAFINNEIVTVGDTIVGYKVIEVQKNKILLNKGTESFYLILPQE